VGSGLTGIVDEAGNVHRIDAVFAQPGLIEAKVLGNVATGRAAAYINFLNISVVFDIFKNT
jgi:hypothetical protein